MLNSEERHHTDDFEAVARRRRTFTLFPPQNGLSHCVIIYGLARSCTLSSMNKAVFFQRGQSILTGDVDDSVTYESCASVTRLRMNRSDASKRRREKLQAYRSCKEQAVRIHAVVEAEVRVNPIHPLEAGAQQTRLRAGVQEQYRTAQKPLEAPELSIRMSGFTLSSTFARRNCCLLSFSRLAKNDVKTMRVALAVRIYVRLVKRAKFT